jgi:hypothetical protein
MMGGDQKQTTEIQVECYAGSHSEESPRSFSMGHSKIKMSEIIDRWLDSADAPFTFSSCKRVLFKTSDARP